MREAEKLLSNPSPEEISHRIEKRLRASFRSIQFHYAIQAGSDEYGNPIISGTLWEDCYTADKRLSTMRTNPQSPIGEDARVIFLGNESGKESKYRIRLRTAALIYHGIDDGYHGSKKRKQR